MKSVMLSIRPKWCELIATGKKTVEVRKTKPNIGTPFKCYIYETKKTKPGIGYKNIGGKVIGEFICDKVMECLYDKKYDAYNGDWTEDDDCINDIEFEKYANKGTVYGWHIRNLVIYDTPKELSEFRTLCKYSFGCDACHEFDYFAAKNTCRGRQIKRPPQSWCYVEEIE